MEGDFIDTIAIGETLNSAPLKQKAREILRTEVDEY